MRQKENRHKRLGTKKISGIGLMIALAFVLSYIESMIPINIGIPGIKAGFSNIVVIFAMYVYGPFTAFGIAIVRIILVGFTFGSLASLMYSFAGGMLSFFVMFILKKADIFSVNGVSVAGGVSHNTGQIIVAMLVLKIKIANILSTCTYNIRNCCRGNRRHSRGASDKEDWICYSFANLTTVVRLCANEF